MKKLTEKQKAIVAIGLLVVGFIVVKKIIKDKKEKEANAKLKARGYTDAQIEEMGGFLKGALLATTKK